MNEQELQFSENDAFEKKVARYKKAGYAVALFIVVGALGGLYGYSPWTRHTVGKEGMSVEYERFPRVSKNTPMRIIALTTDSTLRLSISNSYFEKISVRAIQPEPFLISTAPDRLTFHFPVRSAGDQEIRFFFEGVKSGATSPLICSQHQTLTIHQFLYP